MSSDIDGSYEDAEILQTKDIWVTDVKYVNVKSWN